MDEWEPNLYKNPFRYDYNQITIHHLSEDDVRVFDNKFLPECIIHVDDSWSEDQIKRLIHTAQRAAAHAFEQGKKEKQKEIREVLGFEK